MKKTEKIEKTDGSMNKPESRFEFVTVASARARQLLLGCVPRVDGSPKPARRAVQEVAHGAVTRSEEATER